MEKLKIQNGIDKIYKTYKTIHKKYGQTIKYRITHTISIHNIETRTKSMEQLDKYRKICTKYIKHTEMQHI